MGSKTGDIDLGLLHHLHLMTAKPFLYVFNSDESVLTDEARKQELRDLVAPAEAVFLDAQTESELLGSNCGRLPVDSFHAP